MCMRVAAQNRGRRVIAQRKKEGRFTSIWPNGRRREPPLSGADKETEWGRERIKDGER